MIMHSNPNKKWSPDLVTPQAVLAKIKPGMSIFLGTGVAEPRTLVKSLLASDEWNLRDLELIQLVSLGHALSIEERNSSKFRLKTFFAGWVASEAITAGTVDLIPSRFSRIPRLIESGIINIDVAFIQVTPFDEMGYASLGVAVDVARKVMEQASIVVGEINDQVPCTLGDTFVHVSDFDYLIESAEPPLYFSRWPTNEIYDKLGANVASLVQDGSCISFSIGPLFDALARHLVRKRHLGVHTAFLTDAVMDLIKSGAVTNRQKNTFRGKTLAAYALGTTELMRWLHRNPLIEFQSIDVVANPKIIGSNDNFIVILPAHKLDLTGGIVLPSGKGNIAAGPGEAQEFFMGAALSPGGHTVLAMPSRDRHGRPNLLLSVEDFHNQFSCRESLDLVVTEYGVAAMTGRTLRERALALIDISHPNDRAELVRLAKEAHILFPDQKYLSEFGRLYPEDLTTTHTFKDDLMVQFRAIRPSDVDEMRRLFYRFSDESVYYRYFSPIKTMPHAKMQEYVNVDYRKTMSIVGLVGDPGEGRIVAEGRYVRFHDRPYANIAFVVDEAYHRKGIASFLFEMLMKIAKEKGIKGFEAEVLATNTPMLRIFEKAPFTMQAVLSGGVYELKIPFFEQQSSGRNW